MLCYSHFYLGLTVGGEDGSILVYFYEKISPPRGQCEFLCVYVHICVCSCGQMCEHAHIGQRTASGVVPQQLSVHFVLRQSLFLAWSSLTWLSQCGQQAPGILQLCRSSTSTILTFCISSGDQTQALMLARQTLYQLSHLPQIPPWSEK